MITVKRLKKLIDQLPDEALVMVPGDDTIAFYKHARVTVKTALFGKQEVIADYGEEVTPEAKHGNRQVIVIVE